MKRSTAAWVRKAEDDWCGANALARQRPPVHDLVCFHCQQSAEKYLKALLEELALPVPKTHDLVRLGTLLRPHHPGLKSVYRGLPLLTRYAVTARYPGFTATKRQAVAAVRWADRVREAARRLLRIR